MNWETIKVWLEGGPGIYNSWPWWVGLIICIVLISGVVFFIWAIYDAIKDSKKQKIDDSINWTIINKLGYKKDVVEDFIEIYNVSLKHIVKYKTIENELKNFSTGKVVSLPGKTKQNDDGSSAVAAAAVGMMIGSSMHHH